MPLATQRSPISKGLWAGSIVSALVVLMLLADSVSKIMKAAPVLKAQAELGFPDSLTVGIGVVLFMCILVYVIPRTSILGAILLTGYLGVPSQSNCASAIHSSARSCFRSTSACCSGVDFSCVKTACAPLFRCCESDAAEPRESVITQRGRDVLVLFALGMVGFSESREAAGSTDFPA